MQRTSNLILTVGIFSVVAVMLLFYLSMKTSGPSPKDGYPIYLEVDDAKGLEAGAEVVRAGVPVGFVERMELIPERNKVRVTLIIFKNAELRRNAIAAIQLKSLLGTYIVHISHGSLDSPVAAPKSLLASEEAADVNKVLRALSEIGEGAGGLFDDINRNQRAFFENVNSVMTKLNNVIDENRGNLKAMTEALGEQAPKVKGLFETLEKVQQAIVGENSTVGKLIFTDELHERAAGAARNLEDISAQIRDGKGALGKLAYDEDMASKISEIFDNVNNAAASLKSVLAESQDSLRNILDMLTTTVPKMDTAFEKFSTAGENLAEAAEKINKGDGTISRLINDGELYQEMRRLIAQMRKTFEEGEEQSVLRTFLGVFFGSLL